MYRRYSRIVLLHLLLLLMAVAQLPASALAETQKTAEGAALRFTAAEVAWRARHTTIRVGLDPRFPPLKFTEHGVVKGIEPDYLKHLSEYTGITFEPVIADLSEMDEKVKSGELDMFISFLIPERLEYMTFTHRLFEFKQFIITRNDAPFISGIGSLQGKKIATIKGVKLYNKLLGQYPGISSFPVATVDEMFRAVSERKADALIARSYYAGYLINNFPNLKIAGIADLPPEPMVYAVRKDYPELVTILNKAISAIPKEKHDAIVQKWFNIRVEYRPNWSDLPVWVHMLGGTATLLAIFAIVANMRLKREIKRRILVEQSSKESEQRLQIIFETIEAGIIQVSPQGVIVFANSHMAEMFGMPLGELVGTPYLEHLHESERQIGDERMRQLIKGEIASVSMDRRYIRRDGSDFWGHLSGKRMENPDGSLQALIGVVTDITERKQTECALSLSEEKLRSIVESSPLAMYFYHLDQAENLILTGANPAADRIIGISHQTLLGKRIEDKGGTKDNHTEIR